MNQLILKTSSPLVTREEGCYQIKGSNQCVVGSHKLANDKIMLLKRKFTLLSMGVYKY